MDKSPQKSKKVALITGASRGIGLELVKQFLAKGYKVLALSRNIKPLKGLDDTNLHYYAADLANMEALQDFAEEICNVGAVDVMINNAGYLVNKPFEEISQQDLQRSLDVNFAAPFFLIQKLLPVLSAAHIINVSSIGGVQGSLKFPGLAAYSTAKAGLVCLTEMLSEEFKDTRMVFNCVALGSVDTEMFQQAFPGAKASMKVEDMARFMVNFAEEAPTVIRGKVIPISVGNP